MPGFLYGPWRPDLDDLNSPFAAEAKGCLPASASWQPWPSLSAISEALGATCRGAYVAKTSTGSAVLFAGTATKLYKYGGLGTGFVDYSRLVGGAYALPANEYWTFDQGDNILYAAQAGDVPQSVNIDSGSNFAALAGSPPTARRCKWVGGFLFLLDLTAPTGAIPPNSGRIQVAWSGYRDATFWTYGQRSSDTGTFPTGGFVIGMTGPETGLLIQQDAVNRFQRVSDRRVWDFAKIEAAQGSKSPESLVEHQGILFYRGIDGFVASSPSAFTEEAGIEWVDEWFATNANGSRPGNIIGALDPTRPRIWWLFPTTNNSSSYFLDHIIGFDKKLQRWFHGEVEASFLFRAATPGVTLENLGSAGLGYTLESVPYSLDSPIWQGGTPQVGAFDADQKCGFFSGDPMEALLRTGRMQLIPGKRSWIGGWRPLTDATTAVGRIAVTERPMTPTVYGAESPVDDIGRIPYRTSGRFAVFETRIPARSTWTNIQGGDLDGDDVVQDGDR